MTWKAPFLSNFQYTLYSIHYFVSSFIYFTQRDFRGNLSDVADFPLGCYSCVGEVKPVSAPDSCGYKRDHPDEKRSNRGSGVLLPAPGESSEFTGQCSSDGLAGSRVKLYS